LVEVAQSLEAVIGEEYKRDVDSVSMRFGKRKDMEFSIGKLFFFLKEKMSINWSISAKQGELYC
jgi:hypothetical protein